MSATLITFGKPCVERGVIPLLKLVGRLSLAFSLTTAVYLLPPFLPYPCHSFSDNTKMWKTNRVVVELYDKCLHCYTYASFSALQFQVSTKLMSIDRPKPNSQSVLVITLRRHHQVSLIGKHLQTFYAFSFIYS